MLVFSVIGDQNGSKRRSTCYETLQSRLQIKPLFIEPGSPWENPYIESFIGKFRKECLDRYLFFNLRETRSIIEDWRDEYNHYRPHSALGYMVPAAFAAQHSQFPLSDHHDRVRV